MIKWIVRVFLLGILLVLLLGIFAYLNLKSTQPPNREKAEYAVQCFYEQEGLKIPTRIYYAEKVVVNGKTATMTNYWSYNGERYKKHRGEKQVDAPFTIIRRTQ